MVRSAERRVSREEGQQSGLAWVKKTFLIFVEKTRLIILSNKGLSGNTCAMEMDWQLG